MNIVKLKDFVPEPSLPILNKWFSQHSFQLTISNHRKTKLGDFRPSRFGTHKISVNSTLNQYAFLITLTHEFAHLLVWKKHKNKVAPHGKEWKNLFGELLEELLGKNIFPEPILSALKRHRKNPAASSLRDKNLIEALNQFNQNQALYLYQIEEGKSFKVNNQQFVKGEKRRTRFVCTNLKNNKQYLVHEMAEIHL